MGLGSLHEPSCSQDITDSQDLTAVATEFIGAHDERRKYFGTKWLFVCIKFNVNFLVCVNILLYVKFII